MASRLTIVTTDLKQVVIKTSPGTYLADVHQQACTKLGLNADHYQLKYGKRVLDLGVPYRLSGLTAGAKLELLYKSKTASVISMTLQLPTGERIPAKFPSNFSIWQILRQYESGKVGEGRSLDITRRGYMVLAAGGGRGQLMWEAPEVTIVQREVTELEDLKKSLSQLGFNTGPILVKLHFRKTTTPLHDAMQRIQTMFAAEEGTLVTPSMPAPAYSKAPEPTLAKQKVTTDDTPLPEPDVAVRARAMSAAVDSAPVDITTPQRARKHAESTTTLPESEPAPSAPLPLPQQQQGPSSAVTSSTLTVTSMTNAHHAPTDASASPLAPTRVFAAPASSTPAAAHATFDETQYTPTLEHATAYQTRLAQSSTNARQRLPSGAEISAAEADRAARLAAIASVDVRVRFPDNTSADWSFGPSDTSVTLYRAVRSVLRNGDALRFRLALPAGSARGKRTYIEDKATAGGAVQEESSSTAAPATDDLLIAGHGLRGKVLLTMVLDTETEQRKPVGGFLKPEYATVAEAVDVPEIPDSGGDYDGGDENFLSNGKSVKGKMKVLFGLGKDSQGQGGAGDGDVGKNLPKWFTTGKK